MFAVVAADAESVTARINFSITIPPFSIFCVRAAKPAVKRVIAFPVTKLAAIPAAAKALAKLLVK